MRLFNRVMNISAIEVIKISACTAIGWYLGKGLYTVAVELMIRMCGKMSRMF